MEIEAQYSSTGKPLYICDSPELDEETCTPTTLAYREGKIDFEQAMIVQNDGLPDK